MSDQENKPTAKDLNNQSKQAIRDNRVTQIQLIKADLNKPKKVNG